MRAGIRPEFVKNESEVRRKLRRQHDPGARTRNAPVPASAGLCFDLRHCRSRPGTGSGNSRAAAPTTSRTAAALCVGSCGGDKSGESDPASDWESAFHCATPIY